MLDQKTLEPEIKDDGKITKIILTKLDQLLKQWKSYNRRYKLAKTGKTLDDEEGWDIKVWINFFYRFCKTHASYVVKDKPNINVPAENPTVTESRLLAAKKERALNICWEDNSMTRKLKRAAIRGSIFGDMYVMITPDKTKQYVNIDFIDPSQIIYDTVDGDPESPMLYLIRYKLEDTKILKKKYPNHATRITSTQYADELLEVNEFTKTELWSTTKSMIMYYIDEKYMYTVINASIIVEKKEHWLGMIPILHWKYIDIWDRHWVSLVDTLYESVKMIHLSLSFVSTNAYDVSMAPLLSKWWTPSLADQKGRLRWLITIPDDWDVRYISPPESNQDLIKLIDISKSFMHFVSGMSEEAMAWFTWSLTSAWVAIELRLDSTVRETLDSQVILQDILQKTNAIALKFMEKFSKKSNILKSRLYGERDKSRPFTGEMINWLYHNIVDFGGILPRAESQVVNGVLSKYKMGLISHDTALEELRYADPTLEVTKIFAEQSQKAKMWRKIQSGEQDNDTWFDGPVSENYYMIMTDDMADVLPEQNHVEHYMEHQAAYEKTGNETILMHMQMHDNYIKQWTWSLQPTQEWLEEETRNNRRDREERWWW